MNRWWAAWTECRLDLNPRRNSGLSLKLPCRYWFLGRMKRRNLIPSSPHRLSITNESILRSTEWRWIQLLGLMIFFQICAVRINRSKVKMGCPQSLMGRIWTQIRIQMCCMQIWLMGMMVLMMMMDGNSRVSSPKILRYKWVQDY